MTDVTYTSKTLQKTINHQTGWVSDLIWDVHNSIQSGDSQQGWLFSIKPINAVKINTWIYPINVQINIEKVIIYSGKILGGWDGAALYAIHTNLPDGTLVKVIEHQSGQSYFKKIGGGGWLQTHRHNDAGSNLDSYFTVEVAGYENSRSDSRHINSGGNWRDFKNNGYPDAEQIKYYHANGSLAGSFPSNIAERWVEKNVCVQGYTEELGSRSRSRRYVCTQYEKRSYQYIGSLETGKYR